MSQSSLQAHFNHKFQESRLGLKKKIKQVYEYTNGKYRSEMLRISSKSIITHAKKGFLIYTWRERLKKSVRRRSTERLTLFMSYPGDKVYSIRK